MKKASGKSNLSIVRDYLNGERPFVQVGYDSNVALAEKKEGEEWEDSDGSKWVKKKGYKQRVCKKATYILEQRCSICNADMKWGNYLDEKIYPKTQRCYECNIEFDAILTGKGLFGEYEKFKVFNNQLSAMIDFRAMLKSNIAYLESYTPKTKDPQYFNDDGSSEFWLDDTNRRELVLRNLNEDLIKANTDIENINSALKSVSYNPKIEKTIRKETIKRINKKKSNV